MWRFLIAVSLLLPFQLSAQTGSEVAMGMRASRASSDVVELDSITRPAFSLRDAEVFAAALEIAGDPAASSEARVFALRSLIWARAPGFRLSYADLTVLDGKPSRCLGLPPYLGFTYRRGAPLPNDYDLRIRGLTAALRSDPGTPAVVRAAALCAEVYTPSPVLDAPSSEESYTVVPAEDISAAHICGNRFVVRNPYEVEMVVKYEVEGSGETGSLLLPPKSEEATYSETELLTTTTGAILLMQDGQLIQRVQPSGAVCS